MFSFGSLQRSICLERQNGYEPPGELLPFLVGGAGGAYLAACIAQYGTLLHGPAGLAIPIGVPLIFTVAGYILKMEDEEMKGEPDDGKSDEDVGQETETNAE